eukprot:6362062-Amphidinium_carterae.1
MKSFTRAGTCCSAVGFCHGSFRLVCMTMQHPSCTATAFRGTTCKIWDKPTSDRTWHCTPKCDNSSHNTGSEDSTDIHYQPL